MIAHLKATILQKHPGQVVIDIGSVGYSAVIRATSVKTWDGGGFAATNVSFRWAIILSIA